MNTQEAQDAQPPPTPGEIAYDEACQAISALSDALELQERREYQEYAERLTGSGLFGYTAVGEQVGMAQRMESVAPPSG
jgi:hypothetical protein